MFIQLQIIVEIVLSFFLFLGIIYSFYLSRLLSNLKRDRELLPSIVSKLETSLKNADDAVEKLRIAGEVSGRPLTRVLEQAKSTQTELKALADHADAMADKLQKLALQLPKHEKYLEELVEKAETIALTHPIPHHHTTQNSASQEEPPLTQSANPLQKDKIIRHNTNTPRSGEQQKRLEDTFLARPLQ
ncbi:MAG: hypothetical protein IJ934_02365 [Acetobacter sp.]|nr:hypothetical protein [Acetobacter sp.]